MICAIKKLCLYLTLIGVILVSPVLGEERRIGSIAFFGQEGLDATAVRNALPFQEGDTLSINATDRDEWKQNVEQAVRRVTGHNPTDAARVCCNEAGDILIYIGLPGKSSHPVAYDPAPSGNRRFPSSVLTLNEEINDAGMKAVLEGRGGEDDSAGYSLSKDDSAFRSKQLELREYSDPKLLRLLRSSALTQLLEMARWPRGHASEFMIILGRIAGIEEGRLMELASTGQVEVIISKIGANTGE